MPSDLPARLPRISFVTPGAVRKVLLRQPTAERITQWPSREVSHCVTPTAACPAYSAVSFRRRSRDGCHPRISLQLAFTPYKVRATPCLDSLPYSLPRDSQLPHDDPSTFEKCSPHITHGQIGSLDTFFFDNFFFFFSKKLHLRSPGRQAGRPLPCICSYLGSGTVRLLTRQDHTLPQTILQSIRKMTGQGP